MFVTQVTLLPNIFSVKYSDNAIFLDLIVILGQKDPIGLLPLITTNTTK